MDVKHIISGLIGMALAAGLSLLAQHGIQVQCPSPAASPAAISQSK